MENNEENWGKCRILAEAKTDAIPAEEVDYWNKFIDKYLRPLNEDKEEQKRISQGLLELRNQASPPPTKYVQNLFFLNIVLWRYRYRLYRTHQHGTGTDNYRYSNGQRFRVYWLYWVISGYIYRTGEL